MWRATRRRARAGPARRGSARGLPRGVAMLATCRVERREGRHRADAPSAPPSPSRLCVRLDAGCRGGRFPGPAGGAAAALRAAAKPRAGGPRPCRSRRAQGGGGDGLEVEDDQRRRPWPPQRAGPSRTEAACRWRRGRQVLLGHGVDRVPETGRLNVRSPPAHPPGGAHLLTVSDIPGPVATSAAVI